MNSGKIDLVLTGGGGGAKLAHGFYLDGPSDELLIVANTGDDFVFRGLPVSPDLDTILYTLAGLIDTEKGWGRTAETWRFHESSKALGLDSWFMVGDKDLTTHVLRREHFSRDKTLSEFTSEYARILGIENCVSPATDDKTPTIIETEKERLSFQDYFVREKCLPTVKAIHYEGAATAAPAPRLQQVLNEGALRSVIIGPSNPFLSIAPILAIKGLRESLKAAPVPVIAVSPLIGAKALKGPTAKLMNELGLNPSVDSIVDYYGDMLDGIVIDQTDASLAPSLKRRNLRVLETDIIMTDKNDRARLAREVRDFSLSFGVGETACA